MLNKISRSYTFFLLHFLVVRSCSIFFCAFVYLCGFRYSCGADGQHCIHLSLSPSPYLMLMRLSAITLNGCWTCSVHLPNRPHRISDQSLSRPRFILLNILLSICICFLSIFLIYCAPTHRFFVFRLHPRSLRTEFISVVICAVLLSAQLAILNCSFFIIVLSSSPNTLASRLSAAFSVVIIVRGDMLSPAISPITSTLTLRHKSSC
jgi:hypothetical protein